MTKALNGFNMVPEKGEPLNAGGRRQVANHMAEFPKRRRREFRHRAYLCAAATILLAGMLAGCGSMSPSRVYDRVTGVFASTPASDEPYPNLASVPARPTPPSLAERQQVSSGLVSDRNNAQYTEEVLRNPLATPVPVPPALAAAQQPVASAAPAALPPAAAPAPSGPPVVRLVNGQLVASPGFFGTDAPAGSAPAAASAPAPVTSLTPGPIPAVVASARGVGLNPGGAEPPGPPLASNPAPAAPPPAAAAPRAAANFSQDVVPDAPPPPPFELPARPAPPAPARAPAAVAALPPPPLAPVPAAPPAARLAPAPPEGASTQVAVIYFGDGKIALDGDADKVLDQVASLYRLRGGTVRVIGYSGTAPGSTDIVRSSMAALNLASSRADAVANGLVRHGVRREVIQRSASSEAPPLLEGGRNTGLAGTRRAEIWLDY
jgi:outer membrane protein OmpA-like peptidoglycan-associated protein